MESVEIRATKDQIKDFTESVLWMDIVAELSTWSQAFKDEMMSIVDDAAESNPSTAAVLLHMGDLNGRQKAVDYILSIPEMFLQLLETREKK